MIPDSGAPYVYTQIDASSKANLITGIKNALLACSWTLKASLDAQITANFTGLPANAQTITFDGQVYTFKTILVQSNQREVLIGANAAECASNLADAINANPSTSGTKFSNTTLAHPTCTATVDSVNCIVKGPYLATASETLNNATINSTAFYGFGYTLTSARCPAGLQLSLIIDDAGTTGADIRIRTANFDLSVILTLDSRLSVSPGRLLEFVGCKHQVFIWLLNSDVTYGTIFACGTPAVRAKNMAPTIAAISDNGDGTVKVTTDTPHGRVSGEHVFISQATKDAGTNSSIINGDWPITVLDSTSYVLTGSTYVDEEYDAGSGLSGGYGFISRAFWVQGNARTTGVNQAGLNFRITLGSYNGLGSQTGQGMQGVAFNQYSYAGEVPYGGDGWQRLKLVTLDSSANNNTGRVSAPDIDDLSDLIEARICWPISSSTSDIKCVGTLWNCFILNIPFPMDRIKRAYQGFNWMNFTSNNNAYCRGSLWLATAPSN